MLFLLCAMAAPAHAQIARFQHVILIVQENRTPDNLFQGLCASKKCSSSATDTAYDIQTGDWLDKYSATGITQPTPLPLVNDYDVRHRHADFLAMCDLDANTHACKMDGAGDVACVPAKHCPAHSQFKYVDNKDGILKPYLELATQYGWANQMFQTNQGPSFPAHQFLFGGTSAPSRADDHKGTFAAENLHPEQVNGCIADPAAKIQLIDANGKEDPNNQIYPCFEHRTVADLLDKASITWRYYTPGAGDLWSAPDAIDHICKPAQGVCSGPLWKKNVDVVPSDVFQDIGNCQLRGVTWVIPTAANSDHAGSNTGGGPSWVASIVNAIGNSPCKNPDNTSYWDSTAILITWDDWGGWYDHEKPTFLPYPEGGYQYGFRVPLIFVSAYTAEGYINNKMQDFGSMLRFVESNFGIDEGKLTFADARSARDLAQFYDLSRAPRAFRTIKTKKTAADFLRDKSPLEAPDYE